MDAVLLSRLQFAMTVGFHFIFPPLTIGLAWLMVWFMTKHLRTGEESYLRHARFWTKLFAVTFAVGVATGITMEFQFGTNWADYSRFVGDIFGVVTLAQLDAQLLQLSAHRRINILIRTAHSMPCLLGKHSNTTHESPTYS